MDIDPDKPECWPELPLDAWKPTYATLHMWTQMVGKVRLALAPPTNHFWNVALYVDACGLTTSSIPYGDRAFELRFDFLQHVLVLQTSDGVRQSLPLESRPVADFHASFMQMLHGAGIDVKIWPMPVEVPDPIRFDEDRVHATYEPDHARRCWRILLTVDAIFNRFRSRFIGKCSPVHFFWGSFDLCVSRFSGRRAPARPGADAITREAYSHEVSSVGFWPGGGHVTGAAFYAYAVPEPEGFRTCGPLPGGAHYDPVLGEYILMYDAVRTARSPSETLLEFCAATYESAATLGHWDRPALERQER